MIEDVKGIHEMALINQAFPALESAVNSVLHINTLAIQNVVDADVVGWPLLSSLSVLMNGEKEHQLTHLFVAHAIHHYSNLLESLLTSDSIVIHVPFKSKDDFDVFLIQPFPFSVSDDHGLTCLCSINL